MSWILTSWGLLSWRSISWEPPALNFGFLGYIGVSKVFLPFPRLDSRFWGLLRWSGAHGHPPRGGFWLSGDAWIGFRFPGLDSAFSQARFPLLGSSALCSRASQAPKPPRASQTSLGHPKGPRGIPGPLHASQGFQECLRASWHATRVTLHSGVPSNRWFHDIG